MIAQSIAACLMPNEAPDAAGSRPAEAVEEAFTSGRAGGFLGKARRAMRAARAAYANALADL